MKNTNFQGIFVQQQYKSKNPSYSAGAQSSINRKNERQGIMKVSGIELCHYM